MDMPLQDIIEMRIEKSYPGIVHVVFDTQYELTSTFMRLQEYYESPYDNIRGKYFTTEKYMDTYAKHNGNFTYYTDWQGFNVPGNIVKQFFAEFGDLLDKEELLDELILENTDGSEDFYVLGTFVDGESHVMSHELCHAFWYLDEDFKTASLSLMSEIDVVTRQHTEQYLIGMGYGTNVIEDEMNAYLSTSSMVYITEEVLSGMLSSEIDWDSIYQLQANFKSQTEKGK